MILDDDGRVKAVYAAHDSGRVVNPISIQGQIEGGVLMGLGYALTESFPLKDCVPQAKFGTLGLLRANQIPDIHAIYVEKEEELPFAYGAKGIGEIAAIPTAPAAQGRIMPLTMCSGRAGSWRGPSTGKRRGSGRRAACKKPRRVILCRGIHLLFFFPPGARVFCPELVGEHLYHLFFQIYVKGQLTDKGEELQVIPLLPGDRRVLKGLHGSPNLAAASAFRFFISPSSRVNTSR